MTIDADNFIASARLSTQSPPQAQGPNNRSPSSGSPRQQQVVAGGHRMGVERPAAAIRLEEALVQALEDGRIQVAVSQLPDFGQRRLGPQLARLDLVGQEDDLLQRRHRGAGRGVILSCCQHVGIVDAVVAAKDGRPNGSVQEDGRLFLHRVEPQAQTASLGQEFRGERTRAMS